MQSRRTFIQQTGILSAAVALGPQRLFAAGNTGFESKRPPLADRKFSSQAVEAAIVRIQQQIADPELSWLFGNCFPNTLDTTVDHTTEGGKPDTYVITGDIDAMWLRDSTAQVWPYLSLIKEDEPLRRLVAGVINRQKKNIILDPYANAFYKDASKVSEWKATDITDMKPGIHERKWEIDSLCYPIRLAHGYWKTSGDTSVFDADWEHTIELTLQTFIAQQRKENEGPYTFQRTTAWATDGVPLGGYGYPVKPVGLICSMFRPSDDATIYPFLIPSNFFAVVSLRQAAEILHAVRKNDALALRCTKLADEVNEALKKHATVTYPGIGKVYAYEVNGYGSYNLMDDANVPSLLALPYLDAVRNNDPVYLNTRKLVWSEHNPFFFKGKAAAGIGGPHAGLNMIWPLSITMKALTAVNAEDIRQSLHDLKATHGGTGFMHESFHKDDASRFSRKWFAWANTLFGELVMKTAQTHPAILQLKNI